MATSGRAMCGVGPSGRRIGPPAPTPHRAFRQIPPRARTLMCFKPKRSWYGTEESGKIETMHRLNRLALLAAIVAPMLASPALGQSSDKPDSGGVSRQFSSGADRVAEGATQIGQGIKQGAILTWHAIKDGFNTFADRIGGNQADRSHTNSGQPGPERSGSDRAGAPRSNNATQ